MTNFFWKLINIYIISKTLVFFYNKPLKYDDFQFQNIFFSNLTNIKKIFLSNIFFEKKTYQERNSSYHSFDWLFVAKQIGGANNIKRSKKHIINWIKKKYIFNSFVWDNNFVSKRIINILYNYDFFSILCTNDEKKNINKTLYQHYLILNFNVKNKNINDLTIENLKAFFISSLLFADSIKLANLKINELIQKQIDKNGFHKSYNVLTQAEFINHLFELKNIYLFYDVKPPHVIEFQIINMSSVLLNLFHKDDSVCLFNGSNNSHLEKIYNLLKTPKDIVAKNVINSQLGILIFSDKNSKLFMDISLPTSKTVNSKIHAGTLSFEFSTNNEKIITNCGAIDNKVGKNPDYLRYSAAHSTIIINNTNITELINKKSYLRSPKNITFEQKNTDKYILWEASHDGYLKNFKKITRRKIIIDKLNNNIEGEDSIISTKYTSSKMIYHIRFHLMPGCNSVLTNNKKSVLIKTKSKQSLIFKSNSKVSIEDSIFVNNQNQIKHTKQIVISGYTDNKKKTELWSMKKI